MSHIPINVSQLIRLTKTDEWGNVGSCECDDAKQIKRRPHIWFPMVMIFFLHHYSFSGKKGEYKVNNMINISCFFLFILTSEYILAIIRNKFLNIFIACASYSIHTKQIEFQLYSMLYCVGFDDKLFY